MAQVPTADGNIPFKVPDVDKECYTYYKVFGDLSVDSPALVILHGGPGAGHEYLLPFAQLWPDYNIPVVLYDQIGCGASTHLPETAGNKDIWRESLFLAELQNLLDFLNLRNGFYLLGQSWGGMFGANFAASRPPGLKRLILASAVASKELSIRGTKLLIAQMPSGTQKALHDAEEKGDFDDPGYKAALGLYYSKHLCRADPFPPPELLPTLRNLNEDKTVYSTMNGPSPLTSVGSLLGWTSIPNLPNIDVPTLVYNGEMDTSHEIATTPFFNLIPKVRWRTFPNGGHMCHLEGNLSTEILKTVGSFLSEKLEGAT